MTGGGDPTRSPEEQRSRVLMESQRIQAIATNAMTLGCTVGLYNHGSWFGEPENQLAVLESLRSLGTTNVGLIYNQHHGHDHLDRFPELLRKMKPYLLAININGMTRNGDRQGKKIIPFGQGELDGRLLRIIRDSGWTGPIGILNHTDEDAEVRLLDNLEGLDWVAGQINGARPSPKPTPRSWQKSQMEK